jgi:hypothetical protein
VVTIKDGIRWPHPFLLWPNNFPIISSRDQLHLTPCPPPVVYLSGTCIPYFFPCNHFSQRIQLKFINISRPAIKSDNRDAKTHQPVSASEYGSCAGPGVAKTSTDTSHASPTRATGQSSLLRSGALTVWRARIFFSTNKAGVRILRSKGADLPKKIQIPS